VPVSRFVAIDPKATTGVYKLQVIYRCCIDLLGFIWRPKELDDEFRRN